MSRNYPLVSIVTPCYNGQSFLDRYFSSILNQTYEALELIFVDDGSTDATLEVAESYREAMSNRGFRFQLLHQGNKGQAAAINLALPYVSGEFVTWIDSDDFMYPLCIEHKVSALQSNPDYGFACSEVDVVNESDLNKVIGSFKREHPDNPWLFYPLLKEQDSYCCPIAYLVRADALFCSIPHEGIYEGSGGQNWQLLLPLAHNAKCLYIPERLAAYVVRSKSHSHSVISASQKLQRTYDLEDILKHVVSSMDLTAEERKEINSYIDMKYLMQRFRLAIELKDNKLLEMTSEAIDRYFGGSLYRDFMLVLYRIGLSDCLIRASGFVSQIKAWLQRSE